MEKRVTIAATVKSTSLERSMLVRALLFASLTGIGAIMRIPLSPVPVTMQVFFVLLSGLLLGPFWGPCSQLLYILMGTCGAPFFAAPPHAGPTVLVGPTGGYLWGFLLASWTAGMVSDMLSRRSRAGGAARGAALLAGCLAGIALLYLCGASWLGTWLEINGKSAFLAYQLGIKPFLAVDLAKAALAAAVALPLSGIQRYLG
ncbi:MAG: biotin transporter BioY [Actinobacteria bacterium]|nr:biotin transporter BioY [Actinomycetota bacterium]